MKKYIGLFLTAVLILSTVPAFSSQKVNQLGAVSKAVTHSMIADSKANSIYYGTKDKKLISVLKSAIPKGSNIVYFYSGDLEGKKRPEAFAFVGTYKDNCIDADLWFVTASSAKDVYKTYQSVDFHPRIWVVGKIKMLKVEISGGGSGTGSLTWVVQNSKPVERGLGMNLSYSGNGKDFTAIGQAFDAGTYVFFNKDGSSDTSTCGHTYNEYYFYWTGSAFKEYGGKKITLKQLSAVSGAKKIIDQIQHKGCQISDIYYRANNIININYYKISDKRAAKAHKDYDITHSNATLLYKSKAVKLIDINNNSAVTLENSDYQGIYKAAFYPNIASYPNKFPVQ